MEIRRMKELGVWFLLAWCAGLTGLVRGEAVGPNNEITITAINDGDQVLGFVLIPKDIATLEPGYAVADSLSYDLPPGSNVTFNLIRGNKQYLMQLGTPDNMIVVEWVTPTNEAGIPVGESAPEVQNVSGVDGKPRVVPNSIIFSETPASRKWRFALEPAGTNTVQWHLVKREDRDFVPREKLDIPPSLRLLVPIQDKIGNPDLGLDRPLQLGEKTANYGELYGAYRRRMIVEAYARHGKKDDRWDKPAGEFLEAFASIIPGHRKTGFRKDPTIPLGRDFDEATIRGLIAKGKELLTLGCDDPMVLYALGACYERAEVFKALSSDLYTEAHFRPCTDVGGEYLDKACAGLRASSYPAVCQFRALAELFDPGVSDLAPRTEKDGQRLIALAIRQFADVGEDGERFAWQEAHDAIQQCGRGDLTVVGGLIASNTTGWASNMLCGLFGEIEGASNVRWGGSLGYVGGMGWAAEHYAAAWSNNSARPEAPAKMVQLSMGSKRRENRSLREWFDETVKTDPDCSAAYWSMIGGLVPHEGGKDEVPQVMFPFGDLPGFTANRMGSLDAVYRFGQMCAETKRYDTVAPLFCLAAFRAIENRSFHFKTLSRPGAYETVTNAVYQTAIHPSHARDKDWLLSLEAALAFKYGRIDDAKKLLLELGSRAQEDAFEYMTMELRNVREQLGVTIPTRSP